MKKLILIILINFCIFFSLNIRGEEYPITEINSYQSIVSRIVDNKFNYLFLTHNDDNFEIFETLTNFAEKENNNAVIYYDSTVYDINGNKIEDITIKLDYMVQNKTLTEINIHLFHDLEILIKLSNYNYSFSNIPNYTIDFKEYNPNIGYIMVNNIRIANNRIKRYLDEYSIFYTAFSSSYDQEININIDEPLSQETIINNLLFEDSSGVLLSNYNILESNYNIDNLELKKYEMKLLSINDDNEIYYVNIAINVYKIDVEIEADDIRVSYKNKLNIDDFYDYIRVSTEYDSINITSDYFYNYKKPGIYEYIVYVKPKNNDNEYYKKSRVIVYDDIKPSIYSANNIEIYLGEELTLEDIKNKIWFFDEIDGTIKNKNIDIKGYEDINFNRVGEYPINIKAFDYPGNFNEVNINIIIKEKPITIINSFNIPNYINNNQEVPIITDDTEEKIDNSDYVIYAYTSRKISINEVYELLLTDKIIDSDSLIESDYFESDNSAGHYELKIINKDGSNDYYEIIVLEKNNTKIEEENNNYIWIISISIGITLVIGLIIGMRVYAHVKKN